MATDAHEIQHAALEKVRNAWNRVDSILKAREAKENAYMKHRNYQTHQFHSYVRQKLAIHTELQRRHARCVEEFSQVQKNRSRTKNEHQDDSSGIRPTNLTESSVDTDNDRTELDEVETKFWEELAELEQDMARLDKEVDETKRHRYFPAALGYRFTAGSNGVYIGGKGIWVQQLAGAVSINVRSAIWQNVQSHEKFHAVIGNHGDPNTTVKPTAGIRHSRYRHLRLKHPPEIHIVAKHLNCSVLLDEVGIKGEKGSKVPNMDIRELQLDVQASVDIPLFFVPASNQALQTPMDSNNARSGIRELVSPQGAWKMAKGFKFEITKLKRKQTGGWAVPRKLVQLVINWVIPKQLREAVLSIMPPEIGLMLCQTSQSVAGTLEFSLTGLPFQMLEAPFEEALESTALRSWAAQHGCLPPESPHRSSSAQDHHLVNKIRLPLPKLLSVAGAEALYSEHTWNILRDRFEKAHGTRYSSPHARAQHRQARGQASTSELHKTASSAAYSAEVDPLSQYHLAYVAGLWLGVLPAQLSCLVKAQKAAGLKKPLLGCLNDLFAFYRKFSPQADPLLLVPEHIRDHSNEAEWNQLLSALQEVVDAYVQVELMQSIEIATKLDTQEQREMVDGAQKRAHMHEIDIPQLFKAVSDVHRHPFHATVSVEDSAIDLSARAILDTIQSILLRWLYEKWSKSTGLRVSARPAPGSVSKQDITTPQSIKKKYADSQIRNDSMTSPHELKPRSISAAANIQMDIPLHTIPRTSSIQTLSDQSTSCSQEGSQDDNMMMATPNAKHDVCPSTTSEIQQPSTGGGENNFESTAEPAGHAIQQVTSKDSPRKETIASESSGRYKKFGEKFRKSMNQTAGKAKAAAGVARRSLKSASFLTANNKSSPSSSNKQNLNHSDSNTLHLPESSSQKPQVLTQNAEHRSNPLSTETSRKHNASEFTPSSNSPLPLTSGDGVDPKDSAAYSDNTSVPTNVRRVHSLTSISHHADENASHQKPLQHQQRIDIGSPTHFHRDLGSDAKFLSPASTCVEQGQLSSAHQRRRSDTSVATSSSVGTLSKMGSAASLRQQEATLRNIFNFADSLLQKTIDIVHSVKSRGRLALQGGKQGSIQLHAHHISIQLFSGCSLPDLNISDTLWVPAGYYTYIRGVPPNDFSVSLGYPAKLPEDMDFAVHEAHGVGDMHDGSACQNTRKLSIQSTRSLESSPQESKMIKSMERHPHPDICTFMTVTVHQIITELQVDPARLTSILQTQNMSQPMSLLTCSLQGSTSTESSQTNSSRLPGMLSKITVNDCIAPSLRLAQVAIQAELSKLARYLPNFLSEMTTLYRAEELASQRTSANMDEATSTYSIHSALSPYKQTRSPSFHRTLSSADKQPGSPAQNQSSDDARATDGELQMHTRTQKESPLTISHNEQTHSNQNSSKFEGMIRKYIERYDAYLWTGADAHLESVRRIRFKNNENVPSNGSKHGSLFQPAEFMHLMHDSDMRIRLGTMQPSINSNDNDISSPESSTKSSPLSFKPVGTNMVMEAEFTAADVYEDIGDINNILHTHSATAT